MRSFRIWKCDFLLQSLKITDDYGSFLLLPEFLFIFTKSRHEQFCSYRWQPWLTKVNHIQKSLKTNSSRMRSQHHSTAFKVLLHLRIQTSVQLFHRGQSRHCERCFVVTRILTESYSANFNLCFCFPEHCCQQNGLLNGGCYREWDKTRSIVMVKRGSAIGKYRWRVAEELGYKHFKP